VAVLGGLQCQPQHGTYFVRLSFRFSRIGSRPTPLSVTLPARCRAGNAWWFCPALQGLFFQCASDRHQHFFGLLCCQHCDIAGLTQNPVDECYRAYIQHALPPKCLVPVRIFVCTWSTGLAIPLAIPELCTRVLMIGQVFTPPFCLTGLAPLRWRMGNAGCTPGSADELPSCGVANAQRRCHALCES
jgi:hypothetical protein